MMRGARGRGWGLAAGGARRGTYRLKNRKGAGSGRQRGGMACAGWLGRRERLARAFHTAGMVVETFGVWVRLVRTRLVMMVRPRSCRIMPCRNASTRAWSDATHVPCRVVVEVLCGSITWSHHLESGRWPQEEKRENAATDYNIRTDDVDRNAPHVCRGNDIMENQKEKVKRTHAAPAGSQKMHASARARLASATIVLTSKRHSTTRPSPRPARLAPLIMASSGGYLTKSKQADERRGPDTIPGLYKTIWGQQRLTQQYPRLTTNTNADVCVVGGGIAGVAVAYELARNGVQVVLLESRVVGGGQTGRDFGRSVRCASMSSARISRRAHATSNVTGHVSHWHDDWYSELASMFGRTTARTAATSQAAAVAWVRDTVAREHIQCGFREVPTVLFAADEDDASLRRLRREREACRLVGLDDAQAQAWGFKAPADKAGGVEDIRLGVNQCLVLGGSAQLDPLQVRLMLCGCCLMHVEDVWGMHNALGRAVCAWFGRRGGAPWGPHPRAHPRHQLLLPHGDRHHGRRHEGRRPARLPGHQRANQP